MADFTKYSNYTEETSFSEVVFGADSPLLEVELNEAQQILNTKMNRIAKQLGDGFFPDDVNDYISFSNTASDRSVTIKNSIVLSKSGLSVRINNTKVAIPTGTGTFYLVVRMQVVDATKESVLKSFGDTEGNQIPNKIQDERWDNETSRRKVIQFTLMVSRNIPTDTYQYTYVLLGSFEYDGSEFVNWKKANSGLEQLDEVVNQSLINKNKINALGQIGKYESYSHPRYWTYRGDQNLDFNNLQPFMLYQKTYFFDNSASQILLANLHINLRVGLDTYPNNVGRKIYKIYGMYTIAPAFLFMDAEQPTIPDRIGMNYPVINEDFAVQVIGGTRGGSADIQNFFEINASLPIRRCSYHSKDLASHGVACLIDIYSIYELNSDDVWVETSDTFDNVGSYFNTTGDSLGNINFTVIGDDLSKYGADEAFDNIVVDYNNLTNKPQINDVTLQGNKTSADLHIQGGSGTNNYEDLQNLPTLNGQVIMGDMNESDPVYTGEKMSDEEVNDLLDEIFGEE